MLMMYCIHNFLTNIFGRYCGHLLTYLLNPWCRVLLEKLTGLQLVKKFPAFHGTRRFITALISVRHLSLSWASPFQSIYPHPTSWRSVLILSTHLHLGLPSGLLPSGFPTNTLYTPLSSYIQNYPSKIVSSCSKTTKTFSFLPAFKTRFWRNPCLLYELSQRHRCSRHAFTTSFQSNWSYKKGL